MEQSKYLTKHATSNVCTECHFKKYKSVVEVENQTTLLCQTIVNEICPDIMFGEQCCRIHNGRQETRIVFEKNKEWVSCTKDTPENTIIRNKEDKKEYMFVRFLKGSNYFIVESMNKEYTFDRINHFEREK